VWLFPLSPARFWWSRDRFCHPSPIYFQAGHSTSSITRHRITIKLLQPTTRACHYLPQRIPLSWRHHNQLQHSYCTYFSCICTVLKTMKIFVRSSI
jgi:hypothetical protein